MALHFFLPLVAGGLMAIVWISTLGGAYVLVSGLSIGAFVFALVATARNQAAREDT
jgi:glucose uptake protein GlcU